MEIDTLFSSIKDLFKKKQFDEVFNREYKGQKIGYGIIKGSNTVILVKTGLGGTLSGYKDKYLKIATDLNKKYGYTVICATTPADPFDGIDTLEDAIAVAKSYTGHDITVYFAGHSCGALVGWLFGYKYPEIKRMLLINAPLMVDTLLLEKAINQFNGERAMLVYGAWDRSVKYIQMLRFITNKRVSHTIIPKADHNFTGKLKLFMELCEKYLII